MFGTVLTTFVTLFHLYVFWRVGTIAPIRRRLSRWVLPLMGGTMWSFFLLGRFYGHDHSGPVAGFLELVAMDWMAALFLCTISFLAVDVVTCFGRFWLRRASFLRACALGAGIVLSTVALVQGMRSPVVVPYDVTLPGLPSTMEGTVIVAVSDLHLGSRLDAKWLVARIAQIEALKPDMVFLLGDIYEGHGEPDPELRQAMETLKAPGGVWAVLGNHEFHRGGVQTKALSDNGFTLLRDAWVEAGKGLVLAGVDDLTNGRRNGGSEMSLLRALSGRPDGGTILLSHTPWYVEEAAAAGVGLMLSGHTHGGQIWPFGYLVRQRYPLLAGRYDVDGMTVIVCRGTGSWGPRMRLWSPGEIVRMTLHASPSG